jgi:hypothetical protein
LRPFGRMWQMGIKPRRDQWKNGPTGRHQFYWLLPASHDDWSCFAPNNYKVRSNEAEKGVTKLRFSTDHVTRKCIFPG